MRDKKVWNVKASTFATNTFNPIRDIIENLEINPNPDKPMIALSIGDPTVFGNLKPPQEVKDAVIESIKADKHNGYAPSTGYVQAREAVANHCSTPESPLDANDIILCSGCSCALDIAITALCSPGQNILVSRPGFPLYQTLAEGLGISVKYFNILPERNWEVDVGMLDEVIDESSAAIVLTNPSNPCGSVYSKNHLKQILEVAARNKIPIIADEIYYNFVFEGNEFHWIASLTKEVPVLSCGGLTKRFLIPGWRMGWIAIHDKNGVLAKEVRHGLHTLSQRIIGSNTLVQGAVPTILSTTPQSFFAQTIKVVQENAILSHTMMSNSKGLHPVMPQGAMYMMVRIDMDNFPELVHDLRFVETLISEESVFCLPGKCFNGPNYFRVVLTVPKEQLREACERIANFCDRYYKSTTISPEVSNGVRNRICDNSSKSSHNGIYNGHNGKETVSDSSDDTNMDTNEPISDLSLSKATAILKKDIITTEMDDE